MLCGREGGWGVGDCFWVGGLPEAWDPPRHKTYSGISTCSLAHPASPSCAPMEKWLALICSSLSSYKKQVDLGVHESLPTLTYAEHFCCVLLLKMLFK